MQHHTRAAVPASPSAASSMTSSGRSSKSSSSGHSCDGASSSSLVYYSEDGEYLGDPLLLSDELSGFFGGDPNAPKKAKKVKAPKAPKQKTVKVELTLDAMVTDAQPRESTSRLRRLCKAIVSGSKA